MKKHTLSLVAGLAIQEEHMDRLRTVLNSVAFELVRDKQGMMNAKLPENATGFDVWRGGDMDNFVANLAIKLAAGKTTAEAFRELA